MILLHFVGVFSSISEGVRLEDGFEVVEFGKCFLDHFELVDTDDQWLSIFCMAIPDFFGDDKEVMIGRDLVTDGRRVPISHAFCEGRHSALVVGVGCWEWSVDAVLESKLCDVGLSESELYVGELKAARVGSFCMWRNFANGGKLRACDRVSVFDEVRRGVNAKTNADQVR